MNVSNELRKKYDSLLKHILLSYELPLTGCHGIVHWARVFENGMRLCEETGANCEVVGLFALLHDSRRINEYSDPDHGPRAAEYARETRGAYFQLNDDEFNLLTLACEGHTYERTHPDVTIQTCWDSDRLDLGRVGITPDPERLCTDVAKRDDVLDWANRRAYLDFVPSFVVEECVS